jgi:chromosome segregation ATPase
MSKTGSNLKDVWSELVLIQKKFKGLSLSKEKHQSLWNTLQESFELVKKREDDLFELQKDSWEENYSKLLIKVEEIKTIIEESTSFREIWEKVREVKEYFSIVKTDRERQDALLDNLQKHISKLKKIQNERKEEIEKIKEAGFDKLNKLCNRALNEANTNKDLKEVFNRLKIWQKDVFFASKFLDSQEEKDELKSKIDEAFSIYKKRQEEYFNSKKDEWLSKQKDFLEKMIDKKESLLNNTIPKIKNSIENSKEYLRKIKNELEELENIEENNRKVDFLTNKIGKVESEIIEKENSIIDINKKIDEISQTISDINKKINK